MSFSSLLIKRCSWYRLVKTAVSAFGEPEYTEQLIASDVPCRIDNSFGTNLWEREPGGDFNRTVNTLYLDPTDIQANDRVIYNGSDIYNVEYVEPVEDGVDVHHYEIQLEETRDL